MLTGQALHVVAKLAIPIVLCIALWLLLHVIERGFGFLTAACIAAVLLFLIVIRIVRRPVEKR